MTGHAYGELDPKDPRNAIITDLQLAARNARGMVEYVATFSLAKPMDMGKTSGVLIYEVANRGRIALATASSDPGAMADYFKRGHVLLSSGWQGDIPPTDGMETIAVPIAKNSDGSSITGPVLVRFSDMPPKVNTLPIVYMAGAPASHVRNPPAWIPRKLCSRAARRRAVRSFPSAAATGRLPTAARARFRGRPRRPRFA